MARLMLSDAQWLQIEPLLPAQSGKRGGQYVTGHRLTVEAILWIARTGSPWRDLPAEFGKWGTVHQRFRRWAQRGVFSGLLAAFAAGLDLTVAQIDGTFVKVHQHAAGARKTVAHLPSPDYSKGSEPRQVG